MLLLYNLGIFLYSIGVRVAAAFGNTKANLWLEGRKNWRKKINPEPDERRVWFHCSSLGEFEQGRPLIEAFKEANPEKKIVLTFFSPSGFELRKNYPAADYIFYLPLDTRSNARDFISLIRPEKVFFIKYDYWFHYFRELGKQKIHLYIISGVFREKQIFFKWYGGLFRKILFNVNHFFLQDASSAERLKSIGISNFSVNGDTRFDRVIKVAKDAKLIDKVAHFKDGKNVLVAGSTWREDDLLLADVIKELSHNLKFIIVPHEIGPRHIGELEYHLIEKAGLKPDDISIYSHQKENVNAARVLIVDTVGLLSSIYRYGEFAYVGGGFGKGIHNILEAAVYGIPVFFGPAFDKFIEAKELIQHGGAFAVESPEQFLYQLHLLLNNNEEYKKTAAASIDYVSANGGATKNILSHLSSRQ